MANRPDGINTSASDAALQYRLNVTFDMLAHEPISSPETDRIVDGGVTSFTRFSIVASEF